MRLNRVLLVAAVINIMIFALVFTISCSGEDGKQGDPGEGCTVKKNGSDWDIVCTQSGNQEVVGQLRGVGGKPGKTGPKGDDGAPGEDCWLGPKSSEGWPVLCGTGQGESKGYLNGCTITAVNDYESTIFCGTIETNLCGQMPFDPLEATCDTGLVTPIVAIELQPCGKNKNAVNPNKEYCGYGKDDKAGEPTIVYKICPTDANGSLLAGTKIFATSFVEDRYCRYLGEKIARVAGEGAEDWCDGKPINSDSWSNREYCGYASNEATTRTLLKGACDSTDIAGIRGPNEVAFGQGYCEVTFHNRLTGYTKYSENLCGTSENNKPNNVKWQNQYCGYADSTAEAVKAGPSKVYGSLTDPTDGLCGDSKEGALTAPHLEKYNAGYCTVKWEEGKVLRIGQGKTEFTDVFCGKEGKPNNGTWQGEYCGKDSKKQEVVYPGICDDGQGPNQDDWNPKQYCVVEATNKIKTVLTDEVCDDGGKPNAGAWKNEYCGKKKGTQKTSLMDKGCDDGLGPNSDEFNGGYCTVQYKPGIKIGTKRPTVYSDYFCGEFTAAAGPKDENKINEYEWKGEYCGFKDASALANDRQTALTGVCGDNKGPNASEPKKGFCEWKNETDTATVYSENWCIKRAGQTSESKVSVNEGSWKGQYCMADSVVKTCVAGLVGVTVNKSNDANACVQPALLASCERTDFKYAINKKCYKDVSFGGSPADTTALISNCASTVGKISPDVSVSVPCKYLTSTRNACTTEAKGTISGGDSTTFASFSGTGRESTAYYFKCTSKVGLDSCGQGKPLPKSATKDTAVSGTNPWTGETIIGGSTSTSGKIGVGVVGGSNAASCEYTPLPRMNPKKLAK